MKLNEAEEQLRAFIAKADAALELDATEKGAPARAALQALADELMFVPSKFLLLFDIVDSPSVAQLIGELDKRTTTIHQRCSRLS
jgi:hypothetical protein